MALEKKFSNTVPDEREKKREVEKLTELAEDDRNTIFNLIFSDRPEEKARG